MSQNAEKKKSIFKTHQKVGLEKMKKRFGECSRSEEKKWKIDTKTRKVGR